MNRNGLCVNLMVRNEQFTVFEAIMSTVPHADAAVIVDTGSTDGTKMIIRKALELIPASRPVIYKELNLPSQSAWGLDGPHNPHPGRDLGDVRNLMRDYSPTDRIWTVDADEVYFEDAARFVVEYARQLSPEVKCAYLPILWTSADPARESLRSNPGHYPLTGRIFANDQSYVHANADLSVKYDVFFPGECAFYRNPNGSWQVPTPNGKTCTRVQLEEMKSPIMHYEMATKPWRRVSAQDRPLPEKFKCPPVFLERKRIFGENLFDAYAAGRLPKKAT